MKATGGIVFFRTICEKMTKLKWKLNNPFHPTTFSEEPQLLSTYPILPRFEFPSVIKGNKESYSNSDNNIPRV